MKLFRTILFSILGIAIFIVALSAHQEKRVNRKLKKLLKKKRTAKLSALTKDNSFTFSTYNIWALPLWLPGMEKMKRYPPLPDSLIQLDSDVLCLQEMFDEKIRNYLTPILGNVYQHQNDYTCNRKILGPIKNDCYGGLMTFSKYPILWQGFYANKITEDFKKDEENGRKGYLITKLDTEIGELAIINVHLYAGSTTIDEEMRFRQVKYFEKLLAELELNNLPIIILGDLNCTHKSIARQKKKTPSKTYAYLIDSLQFVDTVPEVDPTDCTYNSFTNKYVSSFMYAGNNEINKLDYCLYRMPTNYQLSVEYDEVIFNNKQPLSDHYGFTTRLKITNERISTDLAP